jgi:hypothetical protein
MPVELITSLDQVTTAWLTNVLTKSGALTRGGVATLDLDGTERELSTNAKIRVGYTTGSRGEMPQRLFLKMVDADMEEEFFGPSEVDYYTRDYVGLSGAPLPRCYDAAYSEQEQRYHLLIDDMSETHTEAWTKAPTLANGLALSEGLALMHAHWWGSQLLEEAGALAPTAEQIRRFVNIAEPGAGHIIKRFSTELEPHWPEMIRALFARHPQAMIERTSNGNGFTIIHGDVNQSNTLFPRNADRPIYIIDRQPFDWSLTIWLAVYDLAYAIVPRWEVETRRKHEEQILRHYHHRLIEYGVQGYSWEQLFDDYRLSAAMCVYVATEWCRGGINEPWISVWLPMLQRTMTACDDLQCDALW